jgi:hypothetical protein
MHAGRRFVTLFGSTVPVQFYCTSAQNSHPQFLTFLDTGIKLYGGNFFAVDLGSTTFLKIKNPCAETFFRQVRFDIIGLRHFFHRTQSCSVQFRDPKQDIFIFLQKKQELRMVANSQYGIRIPMASI